MSKTIGYSICSLLSFHNKLIFQYDSKKILLVYQFNKTVF